MADLTTVIDGQTVRLAACDWVLWSPCGCPRAVCVAQMGDEIIAASEEQAWKEFTPRKRDRDRERRDGYRMELVTHQRYAAEIADQMRAPCPHKTT